VTERENILRAVRFERPDYIPLGFWISPGCWYSYPAEALYDLMEEHPLLFPSFERPAEPVDRTPPEGYGAGETHTDEWGCLWQTGIVGLEGAVVGHPLENWDALDGYALPGPDSAAEWDKVAEDFAKARTAGRLASGSLEHGHLFLRLTYLRGYQNVLLDMADDDPRLHKLIGMIEERSAAIIKRYVDLGAEWIGYPEDLGMQRGPMLSPQQFRTFIKPVYQRLMQPARQAGCIVHMHSDGDIRTLVDDLIDGGVEVINLQDLVNGVDWIAERFAGRVCIDLDVDRQRVTRFGTPADIDALIRAEVEKLGSKEGGLMFTYGLYPGVPLENVKALMDALERYATYYS